MINEKIFWQWVRRTDYCWFWRGGVNRNGYGIHGVVLAHRAAWLITRGDIPNDRKILHHCDNRRCVNPQHLYLGTQLDNMQDMKKRKRGKWNRGQSNHRAKLSEEQVKKILGLCRSGMQKATIARQYGVSAVLIGRIWRGQSWAHLQTERQVVLPPKADPDYADHREEQAA